jgi:hypothetical protein
MEMDPERVTPEKMQRNTESFDLIIGALIETITAFHGAVRNTRTELWICLIFSLSLISGV